MITTTTPYGYYTVDGSTIQFYSNRTSNLLGDRYDAQDLDDFAREHEMEWLSFQEYINLKLTDKLDVLRERFPNREKINDTKEFTSAMQQTIDDVKKQYPDCEDAVVHEMQSLTATMLGFRPDLGKTPEECAQDIKKSVLAYLYHSHGVDAEDIIEDILEPLHDMMVGHDKALEISSATYEYYTKHDTTASQEYLDGYLANVAQNYDLFAKLSEYYHRKHINRIEVFKNREANYLDEDDL